MASFFSSLDHDRIVASIAAAEKRSSGQIRVHVTRERPRNLEARARRRFERLGMTATADRNGVLIYVAPNLRRFQILGDKGIHERCGDDFWRETAAEMEGEFREGRFTEGILRGIQKIGDVLEAHFPRGAKVANELPDEITED
jgi:uncharacterized membrane protein